MTHPTSLRRLAAIATAYAVLLVAGAGCSTIAEKTPAAPTTPATQPTHPGLPRPSVTPTRLNRHRGVVCLPVDEAVARDITAGASTGTNLVAGRAFAYRPRELGGAYLVAMQLTDAGELKLGVWVVETSIVPGEHGPISAADAVAQQVTSWPHASEVGPESIRVSEVRACQLV